jgi:hypothetical protein
MEYNEVKISQDIVNLVVARLEAIPSNIEISIGGDGSFTIKELIERVKKNDEVGKKIIELQLNYLQSLANLSNLELKNASINH